MASRTTRSRNRRIIDSLILGTRPGSMTNPRPGWGNFHWRFEKLSRDEQISNRTRKLQISSEEFEFYLDKGLEKCKVNGTIVACSPRDEPDQFLEFRFRFNERISEDKVRIRMKIFTIQASSDKRPCYNYDSQAIPLKKVPSQSHESDGKTILYHQWTCPSHLNSCDFKLPFEVELLIEYLGSTKTDSELISTVPTLKDTMSNLYLNEDMSDVKLICGENEFPCHKFILSNRSDVFKTMFSIKNCKENQEGSVTINDVSAETMQIFLKFLYRDELNTEDVDCDLLIAAEKYNFKALFEICTKHLEDKIDGSTVMEIIFAAHLVNSEQLLKTASNFILRNRGSIRKCELWNKIKNDRLEIAAKVMELMVFGQEELEPLLPTIRPLRRRPLFFAK